VVSPPAQLETHNIVPFPTSSKMTNNLIQRCHEKRHSTLKVRGAPGDWTMDNSQQPTLVLCHCVPPFLTFVTVRSLLHLSLHLACSLSLSQDHAPMHCLVTSSTTSITTAARPQHKHNKQCAFFMTMASADCGHGDAAPDTTDCGCGDATPETTDCGCGDAPPDATDCGCGDATPETTDCGHGDATPEPTTDHGHGDATPSVVTEKDCGCGDAAPDTDMTPAAAAPDNDDASKCGHGDDGDAPANDASKHGCGDDASAPSAGHGEHTSGCNDGSDNKPKRVQRNNNNNNNNELGYESTHSTSASVESHGSCGDGETPAEQPRRQRHRRRGSVTKCSIESTNEVQQENQDLCQPNREHAMPSDNSCDPATHSAKHNNGDNGSGGMDHHATAPTEEDQFDSKSADGVDDIDERIKGKKPEKVNKMMKGLRQMSKRRFSTC